MSRYSVLLFKSVSHTLSAEKILGGAGCKFKLIPVPRDISTDCGICIRIFPDDEGSVTAALSGLVDIDRIVSL